MPLTPRRLPHRRNIRVLVASLTLAFVLAGGAGCAPRAAEPYDPLATGDLPQYVLFNKSPTAGGPRAWRQARPATFTAASCREIVETLGTRGDARRRVGVHFPFSILEDDPQTLAASLRQLLAAAEDAEVPVLVTLDGQNWWESRSDLWNWWDPDLPGYDPENRHNVEWNGWGPEHAVRVCWRDWGRQIRVRPAPNLASPRFLAEHVRAYDVLVPILVAWYEELPAERKYLFAGVKVGWEASINVNAYTYAGADEIVRQNPTDSTHDPRNHDPRHGWTFSRRGADADEHGVKTGSGAGVSEIDAEENRSEGDAPPGDVAAGDRPEADAPPGDVAAGDRPEADAPPGEVAAGDRPEADAPHDCVPLGYAAVYTAGLARGGPLRKADIERVVHAYLRYCSYEVHRRGVPRHLIFTHQGGTYAPWERHLSFWPAMNEYAIPGWSFYSHDPPECGTLRGDLRAAGRRQWAASEWWRGADDEAGWRARFERVLGFERCRLVTVYNWETFRTIPEACAAVRGLVAGE